jgi:hypothetical protein
MSRLRTWPMDQTSEQKEARERMALFPVGDGNSGENGDGVEVLFVKGDIWVVSTTFGLFYSILRYQAPSSFELIGRHLTARGPPTRQTLHIPWDTRAFPKDAG